MSIVLGKRLKISYFATRVYFIIIFGLDVDGAISASIFFKRSILRVGGLSFGIGCALFDSLVIILVLGNSGYF